MQSTASEIWLPIPGFELLYSVSNQGRVRSAAGRMKSSRAANGGHLYVELWKHNKRSRPYIHRLVLLTFNGPGCPGEEVRHLNGTPTDNRLSNLAWGSRSENMLDEVLSERHWQTRKTRCKHGHEFTPENTITRRGPKGRPRRVCRTCNETWQAEYQRRRKEGTA